MVERGFKELFWWINLGLKVGSKQFEVYTIWVQSKTIPSTFLVGKNLSAFFLSDHTCRNAHYYCILSY